MLIFVDRSRRADHYPFLEWKVRLFVIGASLSVGGMVLERDWIIWIGIVFLVAGFLVRFLPGGRGVRPEAEDEWDEADEWDEEWEGDGEERGEGRPG
ncbi:MAG: hypothetical protein EA422_09165 [Gemmatimonadales bacterium]|nr:MAG: hypothetical protein EA422_09165 [Gemmatimonadales bacterium]